MTQPYPRPDFTRPSLNWQSLNGPWDFIFDDDDVGLISKWQQTGLPKSIQVNNSDSSHDDTSAEDSVVRGIVGEASQLIAKNVLGRDHSKKTNGKQTIEVPFVFQSPASGINDRGVHEVMWYERHITDLRTDEQKKDGSRVILRFGAVDYLAKIWLNGQYLDSHRGGHVPFEVDLTDHIGDTQPKAGHRLTIRVYDSAYDLTQPRGKQYWNAKPESIFYTPSGGIWQNVWLEVVPAARVADSSAGTVIRSNDIESGNLHCKVAVAGRRAAQKLGVQIEASLAGLPVCTSDVSWLPKDRDYAELDVDMKLSEDRLKAVPQEILQSAPMSSEVCWKNGVALWTPEHPLLYDLKLILVDGSNKTLDIVNSSTGMRSINWTSGDGTWRLNGRPYFQALCLDQGYWPESFMTPPTQDALKKDIELAKAMGFNGCRKHQKVEDPAFYYWANKLGYLVWAEMANAYQFSDEYAERFDEEWLASMKLAINHPSVVTWTPVNESWGYTSLKDNEDQRNHIRSLYYKTKTLDPTRSINDNCGWEHVQTDLTTFHDYADHEPLAKTCADLKAIVAEKAGRGMFVPGSSGHKTGAPVMCTEFGGVNIATKKKEEAGEDDGKAEDWGYTTATDPEDLLKRFEKLVGAVTGGGYCCAFVYTQLSDIEQETNGLYSFNREAKMDPVRVKQVIDRAIEGYYKGEKKIA